MQKCGSQISRQNSTIRNVELLKDGIQYAGWLAIITFSIWHVEVHLCYFEKEVAMHEGCESNKPTHIPNSICFICTWLFAE